MSERKWFILAGVVIVIANLCFAGYLYYKYYLLDYLLEIFGF